MLKYRDLDLPLNPGVGAAGVIKGEMADFQGFSVIGPVRFDSPLRGP